MNCKRLALSIIAVFIFIFLFEWTFHCVYMNELYMSTKHLWRPDADMMQYMPLLFIGQFILAVVFCVIYTRGYEGRGIMEGVRYGLYIGLLFTSMHITMHAVAPYTTELTVTWIVGGLLEMMLAGVVVSLVYKK